jgi:hypothetical protein
MPDATKKPTATTPTAPAVEIEEKEPRRAVYFLNLPEEIDDAIVAMKETENISRPEAFQRIFGFNVKNYDRKTLLGNAARFQADSIKRQQEKLVALQAELAKLTAK